MGALGGGAPSVSFEVFNNLHKICCGYLEEVILS